jgi:2-polyprenyl-6-methoxyphenol hydroxylase-like FAD-dependent oxidoreductase
MLIKFQSKAAADVLMYEKHAEPILQLLAKDVKRGIITAEQTGDAIATIEAEAARLDAMPKNERVKADDQKNDDQELDEEEQKSRREVRFSVRAYPLLEMLRAANKQQADVVWGV